VILAGVVIVVIRGFLLRPLQVISARFAALAAGERTTMGEDTDKFSSEMQRLVDDHERIRARGGAA